MGYSTRANDAQPIAAMHCIVNVLHDDFPGTGLFAMYMQSMSAIEACNTPVLWGTASIAIAVDWPSNPSRANSNKQMCSARVMNVSLSAEGSSFNSGDGVAWVRTILSPAI